MILQANISRISFLHYLTHCRYTHAHHQGHSAFCICFSICSQNQLTLMLLGTLNSYWIGLSYSSKADDFIWVDSTPVDDDIALVFLTKLNVI